MNTEIDLVMRDDRIVTADRIIESNLAIANGRIAAIGGAVAQAPHEISTRGKLVLPGGVDTHAHIEQMSGMGQWNADTFETATTSAAMGGTTSAISFVAQNAGQTLADTSRRLRGPRGAGVHDRSRVSYHDHGCCGS